MTETLVGLQRHPPASARSAPSSGRCCDGEPPRGDGARQARLLVVPRDPRSRPWPRGAWRDPASWLTDAAFSLLSGSNPMREGSTFGTQLPPEDPSPQRHRPGLVCTDGFWGTHCPGCRAPLDHALFVIFHAEHAVQTSPPGSRVTSAWGARHLASGRGPPETYQGCVPSISRSSGLGTPAACGVLSEAMGQPAPGEVAVSLERDGSPRAAANAPNPPAHAAGDSRAPSVYRAQWHRAERACPAGPGVWRGTQNRQAGPLMAAWFSVRASGGQKVRGGEGHRCFKEM